jgi:hypothetical protein
MRVAPEGRLATGLAATLRSLLIAARDALRRVGVRTALRMHSIRVRMSPPFRFVIGNTAADRIAVCSLEKKTFPAAVNW